MDDSVTLDSVKRKVSEFRDSRDWLKFDTPRSLAISISVEAAELLEHFQWKTDEQILQSLVSEQAKSEISDELADVLIYCLGFADVLGIDVSQAISQKLLKNGEKYPLVKSSISARRDQFSKIEKSRP